MEPVLKLLGRQFKRVVGQSISTADYDELWAEIADDGSVVHNSKTDVPAQRLCATRVDDTHWSVEKQERMEYAPLISGFDVLSDGLSTVAQVPFYYHAIGEPEIMTTDKVIEVMKENDPEPRHSPQHYTRALAIA